MSFLESLGPRRRFTGKGAASPGWSGSSSEQPSTRDLHFPPGAKLPLQPTTGPCSWTPCAKAGPCQPSVAETWPSNAMWQRWCAPLGRTWHLLFASVVPCASSAPAWAGAVGVPDAGTDGCSRVRAEEFSKVCQLELYHAFFLNEEALTVPNNNCEINNSQYFFPLNSVVEIFFHNLFFFMWPIWIKIFS